MMRTVAVFLLVFGARAGTGVVTPEIRYFRFERPLSLPAGSSGQACAAVPAEVFAHAGRAELADLRLYRDGVEAPFVVRIPEPEQARPGSVSVLNLGLRNGRTAFDVVMPPGRYSDVELDVAAQNFLATVTVSGNQDESGTGSTRLGDFTIFDLTGERLGRSTVLHLPDSDLRYLHFSLAGKIRPGQVEGVEVLVQSAGESSYTTVAASGKVVQKARASVVEFDVPAHVPVERVAFAVGADPAAFSRDVTVSVRRVGEQTPVVDGSAPPPEPTVVTGDLLRVHRREEGQQIDEERLSVEVNGQDLGAATRWSVSIANGDDRPLAVEQVRLEMRQRDVCFEAKGGRYALFYGDSSLPAPQYDYPTLFAPEAHPVEAVVEPEMQNPAFQKRADARPFTERHPALLWVALVAAIALLGGVALRAAGSGRPAA